MKAHAAAAETYARAATTNADAFHAAGLRVGSLWSL